VQLNVAGFGSLGVAERNFVYFVSSAPPASCGRRHRATSGEVGGVVPVAARDTVALRSV
jgi:hypothetical protein